MYGYSEMFNKNEKWRRSKMFSDGLFFSRILSKKIKFMECIDLGIIREFISIIVDFFDIILFCYFLRGKK